MHIIDNKTVAGFSFELQPLRVGKCDIFYKTTIGNVFVQTIDYLDTVDILVAFYVGWGAQ